ncbi:oocyte zinc finger protein XlCOF8.4 [Nasonia vitripennis]|uniref:C2H2-type domain-containing protein n=1 Tax=Nasonia vitripennis TaxID=7425 RepID=A0A7M7LJD2_NASVI|nr:oocyte zinc finger protein XlCOF8.4 [Nasonia vitripennis]
MCARLLACPLCSQPGFLTLDALRAGLVSVATRPLACPVCNEVLLGIDKLTIHLFGHSINPSNTVVGGGNESAKIIEVRNAQAIPIQSWNVLNAAAAAQAVEVNGKSQESARENTGSGIYIPIDEIETFRNLTAIKDASNVISANNAQNVTSEISAPNQVIFLQNVTPVQPAGIYQPTSTAEVATSTSLEVSELTDQNNGPKTIVKEIDMNGRIVQSEVSSVANSNADDTTSKYPPSHTDRLADLVKNAQITASPLGTFHDSYDCSKPEKPTPMKPSIKSTRILSASERTERCNVCGFHFPDKNILLLHKQLVHMIQAKDSNAAPESLMKNYPCHLCTKVFKMRGSLMVHMRVAHPKFNTSSSVRDAQQKKEQKKDPPPAPEILPSSEIEGGFSCSVCRKSFRKEVHVAQHMRVHEGKQWECEICSKMFTTKYFLKKHKRLHSGEMPYKCNLCDKTFTFQQSFHKHRLYHKDDKPHTCMTCGRSFKELSTLHNHERIHTGEKPFACETCGKCFRQRVSYLVHRRIHTGVMPYKCNSCGKSFRYKVSQRTHKCPLLSPEGNTLRPDGCDKSQDSSEMRDSPDSSSQDEQSVDNAITSEENQYVLVLNENGHHVLKRKRDVENENNQETSTDKIDLNKENSNESNDFLGNIWNQETNDDMDYREGNAKADEIVSSVLKDTNLWNECPSTNNDSPLPDNSVSKQFIEKELTNEFASELWNQTPTNETSYEKTNGNDQSNSTADFFSMVMSPLENELSSPSAEMKHLRLSSPVNNQENTSEAVDCFPPMNSNINPVQVDHNSIEDNFSETNGNLSTLQTINEDSLKELLNSIVDK